ncbi:MAG TPA: hypothetical protein PK668_22615 [Myxococcota bacterium]|nr:hypothetical protein [Myxococcota bacterium]HRY95487.1 hypothetical protein [Myxococcota bacterium]
MAPMKRRSTWGLLVLGVVSASAGVALAAGEELAALRRAALEARERDAAAQALQRLLAGRAANLVDDPELAIALPARWLAQRRVAEPSTGALEPGSLAGLVSLLQARLPAPPPAWWCDALAAGRVRAGEHTSFPPAPAGAYEATASGVRVASGLSLAADGDRLTLAGEEGCVTVARALVAEGGALPDQLVARFASDAVYLAPHPAAGFPFRLLRVDPDTGTLAWSAEVWAAGRDALGGLGFHRVELVAAGGQVLVFGLESHGAYLEVFDARTGAPRLRFCTAFWSHFPEAWSQVP